MSSLLRKGTCKHQVTTEILYTFHVRLIKWWTHPFDSTRRTKLSFVAQWDSGKRSSSTEVKISSNILSGTTSMSKSQNMARLYVPWSRANVIASAAYKHMFFPGRKRQNLPLEMRCENPQRLLGSYNWTNQSNWFACLKKYQPINARGPDPDPVVCMKVRFEANKTRGFSLSPRRFRDSFSPLRGLLSLLREKIKKSHWDQGSALCYKLKFYFIARNRFPKKSFGDLKEKLGFKVQIFDLFGTN